MRHLKQGHWPTARFADSEWGNLLVLMLAVLKEAQVAQQTPLHVHIVEIVLIQRTRRIRQCVENFYWADREITLQSNRQSQSLTWRDASSRVQLCQ